LTGKDFRFIVWFQYSGGAENRLPQPANAKEQQEETHD
jgi:hypothetical protein